MPNNNPSGVNSFNHFEQEPAYGQITQEKRLAQGAPVPGVSPLNAPRQAKRRALRPQAQPEQPVVQPQPVQPSPQATIAGFWHQVAQVPGASPLVQMLAAQAQSGV